MAQPPILAQDSVFKLVQNGDLAKTLNTLRTVPGATNPFVASQPPGTNGESGSAGNSSGNQKERK
jgi:hypothetical protein